MTNGSEPLEVIPGWREIVEKNLAEVSIRLQEMASRQPIHDAAHERRMAEWKARKEANVGLDERTRALLRVAELHELRPGRETEN